MSRLFENECKVNKNETYMTMERKFLVRKRV